MLCITKNPFILCLETRTSQFILLIFCNGVLTCQLNHLKMFRLNTTLYLIYMWKKYITKGILNYITSQLSTQIPYNSALSLCTKFLRPFRNENWPLKQLEFQNKWFLSFGKAMLLFRWRQLEAPFIKIMNFNNLTAKK